jgi:putative flippase GtrA
MSDSLIVRLRKYLSPAERVRFIRFCVVGLSGVAVNMSCLALGLSWFPGLLDDREAVTMAATAFGILCSILTNFLFNDRWTWGDRAKGGRKRDLIARLATYALANGMAAGIQFGITTCLSILAGFNIYLAMLAGIGVGTVLNYAANNLWSFKDQGR